MVSTEIRRSGAERARRAGVGGDRLARDPPDAGIDGHPLGGAQERFARRECGFVTKRGGGRTSGAVRGSRRRPAIPVRASACAPPALTACSLPPASGRPASARRRCAPPPWTNLDCPGPGDRERPARAARAKAAPGCRILGAMQKCNQPLAQRTNRRTTPLGSALFCSATESSHQGAGPADCSRPNTRLPKSKMEPPALQAPKQYHVPSL